MLIIDAHSSPQIARASVAFSAAASSGIESQVCARPGDKMATNSYYLHILRQFTGMRGELAIAHKDYSALSECQEWTRAFRHNDSLA
jgi:hypothetical protein